MMYEKAAAYGGVIIDEDGLVFLREPTNHYGGYVWTFAKGRPDDPSESGESVAMREVQEEMGVTADVIAQIPGSFAGSTTENVYYLMTTSDIPSGWDWETSSVEKADYETARKMISQTFNPTGKERDLAVLDAAYKLWNEFFGGDPLKEYVEGLAL